MKNHDEQFDDLERHPISAVWPDLTDEEYANLKESLAETGLLEPILLDEDSRIIDGWHRHKAIQELKEDNIHVANVAYETCDGDPIEIVKARHLARRHMTPGARAHCVVEMEKLRLKQDPEATPKTQRELADEADTSPSTIHKEQHKDDAPQDENGAESGADGDSGAEVITEQDIDEVFEEAAENGKKPESKPEPEQRRSKLEIAEERVMVLEAEIQERDNIIAELNERIALMEGDTGVLEKVQQERKHLKTDLASSRALNRRQQAQIKGMQAQLKGQEG